MRSVSGQIRKSLDSQSGNSMHTASETVSYRLKQVTWTGAEIDIKTTAARCTAKDAVGSFTAARYRDVAFLH